MEVPIQKATVKNPAVLVVLEGPQRKHRSGKPIDSRHKVPENHIASSALFPSEFKEHDASHDVQRVKHRLVLLVRQLAARPKQKFVGHSRPFQKCLSNQDPAG